MGVIVRLNTVPGINTATLLQTYPTSQECQKVRARIGDEMAKVCSDENDFEIAGRVNPGQQS